MTALFYKAPFIEELAAEGGLRGCFSYFRKTASNLSVSVIPGIQAGLSHECFCQHARPCLLYSL